MGIQTDKVKFNVRGKIFETTATTLASAPRNSAFGAMFDDEWNLQANKEEYFIDRLTLASPVRSQASGNCTAISASSSGGCAVAHSRIVRLYDWTLEEHPPINFNYQIINNFVISACKRPERQDSGLALFNSSTGDLRHSFELNHENHVKSFTAGALCFNSDAKIAASCGTGTGIYGCGIWGQVTGKQTDFFHENFHSPLFSYPDRIQWLSGSKCLLVSKFHSPNGNAIWISLLDLRDKSMVWSWLYDNNKNSIRVDRHDHVFDALISQGRSSVCVANWCDDLGFMDLRTSEGGIRWNTENYRRHIYTQPRYPTLKLHGGQLFSCINDNISMFSGPDWFFTSSVGKSSGNGAIRDFSIGGDRLFALHSEEIVFDVWETPFPPNWTVT